MKLKIIKSFDFAHRGCDVQAYPKGVEIDTDTADPELVKVATEEGWISKPRSGKEPPPPPPPLSPAQTPPGEEGDTTTSPPPGEPDPQP